MKDLSFFLLKNFLGAKMKKGFRNFCNNDGSTSTMNQQGTGPVAADFPDYLEASTLNESQQPTLEEMLLQLELEEKMARRKKFEKEYGEFTRHRMSCVNSSDILRTARNALNQYPRFSLDGKDAMYRSSFRNDVDAAPSNCARKSSCCYRELRNGLYRNTCFDAELESEKIRCLPAKFAGERVVWCKPGVVAKLMGLEAMPIPVYRKQSRESVNAVMKRQKQRRSSHGRRDACERRRLLVNSDITTNHIKALPGTRRGKCCSVELANEEVGWPIRRFV